MADVLNELESQVDKLRLNEERNRLLSESSTDGLENMTPLELGDLKHFNDKSSS